MTIIKVRNTPTRKMLEAVIEAWESKNVPRLDYSFPRVVELMLLLLLESPPTADELTAASAKLETKPRGRPRGIMTTYRCTRCNQRMVYNEDFVCFHDSQEVRRYACSALCEAKLRECFS